MGFGPDLSDNPAKGRAPDRDRRSQRTVDRSFAACDAVGFLFFRLFDIYKPYPIRKLERLHGGLGVMADDALAGVYAAVALWMSHFVGLA